MKVSSTESQISNLFGVTASQLDKVISAAVKDRLSVGAFCDVYLQAGTEQNLTWDQGILKRTSCSVVKGAGVRVVIGDKTGYSHTDHLNFTNLTKAAKVARAIADHTSHVPAQEIVSASGAPHNLYMIDATPIDVELSDKIALMRAIDAAARAYDPRIKNVTVSLGVEDYNIGIASSLRSAKDSIILDNRPLVRISVSCLAEENGRKEQGSSGGGGRYEFGFFTDLDRWRKHALDAAKEAVDMLAAVPAPAGEMTVVLGPGWPGVLIHEAVGHGLEGDFNRKGTSAFSKLMGQQVASSLVTVVDEGILPGRRGSLNVDDEGTPTQSTVLIENGILKGYMQDRMNAGLMGVASTGNCRRESYKHAPMPRMTNTYMAGGQQTQEEIIRSVKRGIFATTFGGGQVDITNGNFTFSARGAFLIEDGKLTTPVKGATLIGNGPKALHKVSMVGNDMALDEGIGTCGKAGQGVPVGVGMPTVRIDEVTVGGTGR
jgi:TldD protein